MFGVDFVAQESGIYFLFCRFGLFDQIRQLYGIMTFIGLALLWHLVCSLEILKERKEQETMPIGKNLNEPEPVNDEREGTGKKDTRQSGEEKRGNRTGLVTAMLRHYATCLELKLGGVCTERSR